jgi:hypothetical protein
MPPPSSPGTSRSRLPGGTSRRKRRTQRDSGTIFGIERVPLGRFPVGTAPHFLPESAFHSRRFARFLCPIAIERREARSDCRPQADALVVLASLTSDFLKKPNGDHTSVNMKNDHLLYPPGWTSTVSVLSSICRPFSLSQSRWKKSFVAIHVLHKKIGNAGQHEKSLLAEKAPLVNGGLEVAGPPAQALRQRCRYSGLRRHGNPGKLCGQAGSQRWLLQECQQ